MEDLEKQIQNRIFSEIKKKSSNSLLITKKGNSKDKNHRIIKLKDRVPSKKFDVIFFQEDSADYQKISKYYTKFNKYLIFDSNNQYLLSINDNRYPYLKIKLNQKILDSLDKFEKEKELKNRKDKIQEYIEKNALKLDLLKFNNNDFDFLVFFKDKALKEKFEKDIENRVNIENIHEFYSLSFLEYSKGIDNRNLRFRNNVKYIFSGIKSFYSNIFSLYASIKAKITSLYKKIKVKIPQKPHEQKADNTNESKQFKYQIPKIRFFKRIRKLLESNLNKFYIRSYIKKNIPQIKAVSYEEYISREKGLSLVPFSKNRPSSNKLKVQPKVSILMVIDDIDEIWLNKSVRCIKDQTYKNWELIIIDNCSSRTYLKSYLSSLNDPRIKTHFYNSKKTFAEALSHAFKESTGAYISVLGEGDEIEIDSFSYLVEKVNQQTNLEYIYSDEDQINEQGKRVSPFIKPEWDRILATSYPYSTNIFFAKRELIERIDAFKSYNIKDPIWDFVLRMKEATKDIYHIPLTLYHKRIRPLRDKTNDQYYPDALKNYINRDSIQGIIKESVFPNSFYILKKNIGSKKIAIISTENNQENLISFISSLKTLNYKNYVINIGTKGNLSMEDINFFHYRKASFSDMFNNIASQTDADYLLFIDSKTRIKNPETLNILLSQIDENSIIGTKIIDPDNIIQDSIYVKNLKGIVSTLYEGQIDNKQFEINVTRGCSAISKKCMLISKELFLKHQFDRSFKQSYQDIDLCFSIKKNGGKVIYTPDAVLESVYSYTPEAFNTTDSVRFIKKWRDELKETDNSINVKKFLYIR